MERTYKMNRVISRKPIKSVRDDGLEKCDWCDEEFDSYDLHETDLGNLCEGCIAYLRDRGEEVIVKSSRKPIKSGVNRWNPNDNRTVEEIYRDEIVFELDACPGIVDALDQSATSRIAELAKDPNSEIGRCVAALARACDEEYYNITKM